MIRPQPRAAITGPNRWPSRNGAVRLTAMVRSQSARLSDGSGGRRFTPAQLTRMSGSPNAPAASSAPRSSPGREDRSALTQAAAQPAGAQPVRRRLQACRVPRDQHHPGPGPGQRGRHPRPDPRAPAGHHRYPAGQREQLVQISLAHRAAHSTLLTAPGGRR